MGGVLIDLDLKRTLSQHFREEHHDLLLEKVFNSQLWRDMDAGVKRADEVISVLVPQLPEETQPLMKEMISNFYPYMPPLPYMEAFIKRLKKAGFPLLKETFHLGCDECRRGYDPEGNQFFVMEEK